MALNTKSAPFLMNVLRKAAVDRGSPELGADTSREGTLRTASREGTLRTAGRGRAASRGRRYVGGELFCVGLYGWLELRSTVYTLSTLLNFSKNGIKSNSSESVMSSNHDATGTCKLIKLC